ncbi:MAG: MBOAT family O-acyltransferase [Bacillota bacterium]|jgi:alginate O-acetyltransferase complex protein AlgI|nr:MBOAT family O-acyltransferase [Bacillota bacterium]NLL26349.1 MBOAT family protein [Erysipelotrichia bacterium]
MLFSSIPFLFYFLPIVVVLYFIVPRSFKNVVLLVSSLFFYGWGEPRYVILMIISILAGYFFGLSIEKNLNSKKAKILVILSVIFNLLILGYFKYVDFFIDSFNCLSGLSIPFLKVSLPVGISFYTFQILSYTIDVYRGHTKAQQNIISLATYICMFPQLIAGPIVRYADIEHQLTDRTHSFTKAGEGIKRFVIGLTKKVLLANLLGEVVSKYAVTTDISMLYSWLSAFCYSLQIYFDFSGYSDMAIGLGKIFGFDFLENFNYPFIAKTVTEFWRRWHMSLGQWFRDYLYIPLGGNRVSKVRWLVNIFIVWFATGFWHGASYNFIIWGLFYGFLLIIEKLYTFRYLDNHPFIGHIYIILITLFGFVLFNAADLSSLGIQLSNMLGLSDIPFISYETIYYLRSYVVIIVISIAASTPLFKNIISKLKENKVAKLILDILEPFVYISLFILVISYLVDGSFNPFLYFRF